MKIRASCKANGERDENAPAVIKKALPIGAKPDPLHGLFEATIDGKTRVVQYEVGENDTEQVPLKEPGGIEAFFEREVLPHAPDAWIAMDKTQIGYEISFARYFYKPTPLRTLEEIRADILKLEQQSEGLLHRILGGA